LIKRSIRRALRRLGYDVLKLPAPQRLRRVPAPPALEPVWPLPRQAGGPADDEIRAEFARHPHWHYAYEFAGGLSFPTSHNDPGLDTDVSGRQLQRFRHFMPYLGSLEGKRVLDIACNSGFWSIQCALMGADVVGFDARPELIAQANLLKRITGAERAQFRVLDFREMSPEALGGTFDVVLNLGFLYHVAEPIAALERTKRMARKQILLDTAVHPSDEFAMHLKWEEPSDIRMAAEEGMVALPTKPAVELMLRHLRFGSWIEIPVRTRDLPLDYRTGKRASWLIDV
jgi:tRNA (mo5U34)-methyltransferase